MKNEKTLISVLHHQHNSKSNQPANTVDILYLWTHVSHGGNYRQTAKTNMHTARTLINMHTHTIHIILALQLEFLISWSALMEINGQSLWWIPTSSIIIPAWVPVRSNYILKIPSILLQPPSTLRSINNFNFQMPRNVAPFTILVLHFAPFFCLRGCRFASRENQMSYTKSYAELITHHVYSSLWFLRLLVRSFAPRPRFSLVSRSMSFLLHPLPVWCMGGGRFPLFSSLPHN